MRKNYSLLCLFFIFLFGCAKSENELARDIAEYKSYVSRADMLYDNSEYSAALQNYLKADAISDEKNGLLYYKIAFCYDKGEQNLRKAKKYYEKALKYLDINKELKYVAATYFNLGVIAFKENDIEKKYNYLVSAYSLLTKLEKMKKTDGVDLFRLAYYYMENKQNELAIEYYQKAIKKFKEENSAHFYYAGAYFNIGKIYWDNKNIDKAIHFWNRAVEIEPSNKYYREWYEQALQAKK